MDINVQGFSGRENKEFQKHLGAVKYCIEHQLSFPKETSEFFKGKVGGDDLEDIVPEAILPYIENGMYVPIKTEKLDGKTYIRVRDLPEECDVITISLV